MKYIDWLNKWLKNYVLPSVKIRKYEKYSIIVNLHIRDKIGTFELKDLSPLFYSNTLPSFYKAETVKRVKDFRQIASMQLFWSCKVLSRQQTF